MSMQCLWWLALTLAVSNAVFSLIPTANCPCYGGTIGPFGWSGSCYDFFCPRLVDRIYNYVFTITGPISLIEGLVLPIMCFLTFFRSISEGIRVTFYSTVSLVILIFTGLYFQPCPAISSWAPNCKWSVPCDLYPDLCP